MKLPRELQVPMVITDIVLIDVVEFSRLSDEDQMKTVLVMNHEIVSVIGLLCGQTLRDPAEAVLGLIPTGDGTYVILHPGIGGYGPLFAVSIRNCLLMASQNAGGLFKGVRVAAHLGSAMPYYDLTGRTNFVGSGLNNAARLLQLPDDIKKEAEGFSGDKNFVVVSRDCWRHFEKAFALKRQRKFYNAMKFRWSNLRSTPDKHPRTRKHRFRFVESSRHVVVNPPRPSDIQARMKQFAQQVP